jgi:hypothetical protein
MRLVVALFLLLGLSVPTAHAVYTPDTEPTPASTPAPNQGTTPAPTGVSTTVKSELSRISAIIYRNDFKNARAQLLVVDRQFPNDADVNNLLGYTSRKLKLYSSSATYYNKALRIDPKHLDALEYQGELFVATKKIAMAKRNLLKLEKLCGVNCSQHKDLKNAIGSKN